MNNIESIGDTIASTLIRSLNQVIAFIPNLIAGSIILAVGWGVATLLRELTKRGLHAVNAPKWFGEAGITEANQQNTWVTILSQLAFWIVIFIFLIPTFEALNLTEMNVILNELFLYLPKVFAGIVVGFVGFVLAKLVGNIVENATDDFDESVSRTLSGVARTSILVFTGLIVLNQLGIASNLIQILFSAVMFGVALATGLAFGLGGKEPAQELLTRMLRAGEQATKKMGEKSDKNATQVKSGTLQVRGRGSQRQR
jgi:hypothetical protein